MATDKPSVDDVLAFLHGDLDKFREILTDKEKLLEKVCCYAEYKAKRKKVPAWSVIGEIFCHGSGVSSAIYELYRNRPHDNHDSF